jgi:hypothetical protein
MPNALATIRLKERIYIFGLNFSAFRELAQASSQNEEMGDAPEQTTQTLQ